MRSVDRAILSVAIVNREEVRGTAVAQHSSIEHRRRSVSDLRLAHALPLNKSEGLVHVENY
jgi:hypothetical protein